MHLTTERMPRQDSRQHAHRGTGVAAVKTGYRLLQAFTTIDLNLTAAQANLAAELAQTCESTGAIGARGKVAEARGALGQCAEHGVAMRD